jgi:hypothetical protein
VTIHPALNGTVPFYCYIMFVLSDCPIVPFCPIFIQSDNIFIVVIVYVLLKQPTVFVLLLIQFLSIQYNYPFEAEVLNNI